ncbi:MAG: hypothetical protein RR825_07155, partial [Ruthenibacterium sp.]
AQLRHGLYSGGAGRAGRCVSAAAESAALAGTADNQKIDAARFSCPKGQKKRAAFCVAAKRRNRIGYAPLIGDFR